MMLLGIGAQAAAGVVGEMISNGDRAGAEAYVKQAMDATGKIDVPKLERISAQQTGPTELNNVHVDPNLRQAQMDALNQMQELGRNGGLDLAMKADLAKFNNRSAHAASAARQGIEENFANRGQFGSGAELASSLMAGQDQVQRQSEQGMQTAAMAQRNALESMMNAGRLGGDVRGQDYSEQARKAQAQDAINQSNAAARERAGTYNARLGQQDFENRMRKGEATAGGYRTLADMKNQDAQRNSQMAAGIGKGASEAANTYAGYKYNQDKQNQYSPPPLVNARGSQQSEWNPYDEYSDDPADPYKRRGY